MCKDEKSLEDHSHQQMSCSQSVLDKMDYKNFNLKDLSYLYKVLGNNFLAKNQELKINALYYFTNKNAVDSVFR